jgi:hypothetical protein
MARHQLSNADRLYLGSVRNNRFQDGKPGLPISPLYVYTVQPAVAVATAAAASQAVTTAWTLNGTLASGGVVTFDVPRNVVAAWTNTAIITITGTDAYGLPLVEASASGTSHTGNKAFKTITSITSNAALTAATAGTGAKLGLPIRSDAGSTLLVLLNGVSVDAATAVRAVTTAATSTTGDVRGTVTTAGTMNATNYFMVLMGYAQGQLTDYNAAYGVAQFAG